MPTITIQNTEKTRILYQGDHPTPASALEHALHSNINLCGADLSGLDLSHANLDGLNLSHARLNHCDLTGINLCEANLTGTQIQNSDLTMATLCEAQLIGANLHNTSFAATLITHTQISGSHFTCPSTFTLNFTDAILGPNTYQTHIFSAAPIVITGLPKRLIFLDDVILINNTPHPRPEFSTPFEELFKKTS